MKKYAAEAFGTFWLVFGGCGSAVLAAAFPQVGIGLLGVSLAFGLTVLTMAYAIGHISGCHLNPAVSVGLWAGGRFPANQLLPYIGAQVIGAIVAGGVLYLIASGKSGFDLAAGFASNGYGAHSPGGYSLTAALVAEVVDILRQIDTFIGFKGHGMSPKSGVVEQRSEAFQANVPFADVRMPVHPAAAGFMRVVEMKKIQMPATDMRFELGHSLGIAGGDGQIVAGSKNVAGIKANTHMLGIAAPAQQPAQFLKATPQ